MIGIKQALHSGYVHVQQHVPDSAQMWCGWRLTAALQAQADCRSHIAPQQE